MMDHGIWLMCHLARVVPAAGVYASTLMLTLRLQGADGGLRIASWLIFAISAGLLALTSHRSFSAEKAVRIAVALALVSVVQLLTEPSVEVGGWSMIQEKLKPVVVGYLRNASLAAFILAVVCTPPARVANDQDFERLEEHSSQGSQGTQSLKSWSSSSPKSLPKRLVSPQVADWLSEVSSVCYKHMGPKSKASSRSSHASDISLHSEPGRIDAAKALWISYQAEVAKGGSQDQGLQTIPQNPCDLPFVEKQHPEH